jgi:two-component system LytT family response regulator
MIKAVLIDDEPLARSIVKEYLQSYINIEVVQECGDGFEGVKAITQHQPELIFLDVQMPKINGFEMLELLEKPPAVIFTTAFDDYAMKAFEANAIDYLLKPFGKDRFDKAMQKWKEYYEVSGVKPGVKALMETAAHPPDQLKVKIHTAEGSYLKKKTMGYFEEVLDSKQFVRVHRSYLVHVMEITKIEPYEKDGHVAILKSGVRIPISKTGYPKLKTLLGL